MSVTYQIEPVIGLVRAFIDQQFTSSSTAEQPLPLLSAITQYAFDASACPMLVVDPVNSMSDWSHYAAGDVTLTLEVDLHEIRVRSGAAIGEELVALDVLTSLAAAFANNYRLDGNVQNVLVEKVRIAEPDTLHRLGIPIDEHTLFAVATMKIKVYWIESCFTSA